jgi:hypothetical protein
VSVALGTTVFCSWSRESPVVYFLVGEVGEELSRMV